MIRACTFVLVWVASMVIASISCAGDDFYTAGEPHRDPGSRTVETSPVEPSSPRPQVQGATEGNSVQTLPLEPGPAGNTGADSVFAHLNIWGYGEAYYNSPVRERNRAQADLARAVFGIGYQFDERTEFNSEYEVEHTVASSTDVGEFEVEQFWIDHQFTNWLSATGGLFLMPFGFLNEHHEPTNFYGVQRNFVETLIIPSTWREGGFGFHGDSEIGLKWNVGLTTGFDLSKWNFLSLSGFPPYATALSLEDSGIAPLQATHQELALANGEYLSQYLALNYNALPGFNTGASVFTGDAVRNLPPLPAPRPGNQRVTLWEAHSRWTHNALDLSALYARGTISDTALSNAANPGSPNPIPAAFYGYFVQAAYTVWQNTTYRLTPFARWEGYNMGSRYEGTSGPVIPIGAVPVSATPGDVGVWPRRMDRVWTAGVNFYVTPKVVVKGDYQSFEVNHHFTRFDLGLGLSF